MTYYVLGSRRTFFTLVVFLFCPFVGLAMASADAGPAASADPAGLAPSLAATLDDRALTPSGLIEPQGRPGFFDVARESIFGPKDRAPWTPVPLQTLFTEGWRDPWIMAPPGPSGALRQGWIGAADGNFYRLYYFSYNEIFDVAQGGNGYATQYNLYTPLSRRLLLLAKVPYFNANSPSLNLATTTFGTSGASTNRSSRRGTSFGDLTLTPRVMLAESQAFSLSAEFTVQVPTGATRSGAGRAILSPGVHFWADLGRRWSTRGGFNVSEGVNKAGSGTTLTSQLAVGRTITPHDTRIFGEFTTYLTANVSNQVAPRSLTTVTLGPGFRTHLGHDYYLLGAATVPVVAPRPYDESMTFWFMKLF